jgi:3-methyladenine DNA glycosylase AlkD
MSREKMTTAEILEWLESRGSRRNVEGMARYGIVAKQAFGVSMAPMQSLTKKLGKDHALALELWQTGWHEARTLAAFLDEPGRVTRRQMSAWVSDFDNWAICDTVCFHLFDRSPFAWEMARRWAGSPREFVKRAGFALMASLGGHDRATADAKFLSLMPLIERGARDERNFVKKGVSWALRRIGGRSPALHDAAMALARRLAESPEAACRWVGRDALRDLSRPLVRSRLARRKA